MIFGFLKVLALVYNTRRTVKGTREWVDLKRLGTSEAVNRWCVHTHILYHAISGVRLLSFLMYREFGVIVN